jgi:hypothetical protein
MPLSETTPDSDLLSCLRRYIEEQFRVLERTLEPRAWHPTELATTETVYALQLPDVV